LTIQGACDDGDACTDFSVCDSVECVGGPVGVCDDGNSCTVDFCDSVTGCVFAPEPGLCDDGDACTINDACVAGICGGVAVECQDSDEACLASECVNGECVSMELTGSCDDGDPNTCDDACANGTCGGISCELVDGTTCATAVDLDLGGYYEFDLCEKKVVNGPGSCYPDGLDHFVKVQAQYSQASFKVKLIQGFPALLINFRFYTLDFCEQPDNEWFCYENETANPGWSGYPPENDVYVGFGSSDGSCGVVAVEILVTQNN